MNKNGFGLRKELAFILLFLFCILVSVVGLNQFNSEINGSVSGNNYKSLENKLTSAALDYYNDKYTYSSGDVVIIKYDTLYKNGYISKLKDSNGFECSGYTKVVNSTTGISYINCFTYKTTGYSGEYE